MAVNIYPPILASSQPAFISSTPGYNIYFTLPNTVNLNEIKHIQIKIVYQTNNKSIAKTKTSTGTDLYPDGVIYKSVDSINREGNNYFVTISQLEDLADGWTPNTYYKVQMRFGTEDIWRVTGEKFADWKARQIQNRYFSEWSTVMVLKAITEPRVEMLNSSYNGQSNDLIIESVEDVEMTTNPLFTGTYYCSAYELEDQYKFDLYKGNSTSETDLIETSDWLQHDSSRDSLTNAGPCSSIDSYRFEHILTNMETYTVVYSIRTENEYEKSSKPYVFMVVNSLLARLEDVFLICEDQLEYNKENACINIKLTSSMPLSGNYIISRASELDDYLVWEDLHYLIYSNEFFDETIIYQDFTIESGIKYKYAFQQENSRGLRTSPVYEGESIESSPERVVNFRYNYLYHDNLQLKLQFDSQISSLKHTTLTSKQDTIGSKYPTITRNGYAYYAEFPITGLITLHMDNDETFFQKENDGYYFLGEKIINQEKYTKTVIATSQDHLTPSEEIIETFGIDLTEDNKFIERKFRDKVERFLNNNDFKLFKSSTEGNIVVTLMNVSMTPKRELDRMIYAFSATAYEVAESTIGELNKYGIINIGNFSSSINNNKTLLLGQLNGFYQGQLDKDENGLYTIEVSNPDNLIHKISENNTYEIGGGYQYKFLQLNSIWVEQYPKLDYQKEVNRLKAEKAQANISGDLAEIERVNQEIIILDKLMEYAESEITYPLITLVINGQEISLGTNKIYHLKDLNLTVSDSIYLKYTKPIILNYTCEVTSIEASTSVVTGVVTSSVWNQIEGIFTETDKILNNYDYYRVPDILKVSDRYNIGLYQSLNILDIIKEDVKTQIEENYNTKFTEYDPETTQWTDGKIYYNFEDLTAIEIEADQGTVLIVGRNGKLSDVSIGPTEKYVVRDMSSTIDYLAFKEPTYSIINYKCTTIQMAKG